MWVSCGLGITKSGAQIRYVYRRPMLKSLIQPLQLFLKGATGKDRQQIHQLTQQIMRLQVAYDGLQQDYTSLEQQYSSLNAKHSGLKTKHSQLRLRYEELNAECKDINELLDIADSEAEDRKVERGDLRSQIKRLQKEKLAVTNRLEEEKLSILERLEKEKSALLCRVAVLENELGLREYSSEYHPPQESSLEVIEAEKQDEPVDLSGVTLALVGGHETTHREVKEALKKYGLKRCIHVPPHSQESNSRHQIKDKISNCDLIVTITSYVDHSVTKCVKQLKENHILAGDVIRVHTHGKSSVVREVLNYFAM